MEESNTFLNRAKKKIKNIKNKKRFFAVISTALILLSIGTGFGINYYKKLKNPQDLFIPEIENNEDPTDIDISEQFDRNIVNILMVGFDRDEKRSKEESAFRTDTNVVASINLEKKTVDLLSVPRDSYVPIANMGGKKDKFNSSFVYGYIYGNGPDRDENGYKYLLETTRELLGGAPLHYYVAVDMDVVVEIVEAIGGVELDIPEDVVRGNKVRIKKGYQKLDGRSLLFYARNRNLPGGDIDRVKNQQRILMAIFDTLKKSNKFTALPKIYRSMMDKIDTNLNFNQLTALALFGMELDKDNINMHMLKGNYGHFNGISYWIVDQEARVELIEKLYGLRIEPDPQDPIRETAQSFKANITRTNFEVGQQAKITARGATNVTAYKEFRPSEMRFSSSNSNVVVVDKNGIVKAVGPGEAIITVSIDGLTNQLYLVVNKPAAHKDKKDEEKDHKKDPDKDKTKVEDEKDKEEPDEGQNGNEGQNKGEEGAGEDKMENDEKGNGSTKPDEDKDKRNKEE
ncbi:MAG TPA: LCP family protein [Tissierellaceae bacterium]|nr:LCP family protein [Tissierellaceae bacterium]